MPELSLYQELKTWQQGLAALLGFMGLMAAALWNFRLNRKRDALLRFEEMISVTAALYGEMILLRARTAHVARIVANVYVSEGTDPDSVIKFDKHLVEANKIPEPLLFKALAPRFGLLPADLVVSVSAFYEKVQTVTFWLPQLIPQADRGYSHSILTILHPAYEAVEEVMSTLRRMETMIGIDESQRAKKLDLGKTEGVIEMEELSWEEGS